MADIKPTALRAGGALTPRVSEVARPGPTAPVRHVPVVSRTAVASEKVLDPVQQRMLDFIDPPRHVSSWLSDPRLVATLEAASAVIAPDGKAENPADRYAASVIETHLVAQRHLTRMTNAMLKT